MENSKSKIYGGRTALVCTLAAFVYVFGCGDLKSNFGASILSLELRKEWPIWVVFLSTYAWALYQFFISQLRVFHTELQEAFRAKSGDEKDWKPIRWVSLCVKRKLLSTLGARKTELDRERENLLHRNSFSSSSSDVQELETDIRGLNSRIDSLESMPLVDIKIRQVNFNSGHIQVITNQVVPNIESAKHNFTYRFISILYLPLVFTEIKKRNLPITRGAISSVVIVVFGLLSAFGYYQRITCNMC